MTTLNDSKVCWKCLEDRPLTEFNRDRRRLDGLRPYCQFCTRLSSREHNKRKRGEYRLMPKVLPDRKWCQICKEIKPRSEYHRNNVTIDGLQTACRTCIANLRRRKLYGLTNSQFDELSRRQGNACSIRGVVVELLHIDHDHASGTVRGLICGACNRGLGSFRDDPAALRRAAAYLEGERPSLP